MRNGCGVRPGDQWSSLRGGNLNGLGNSCVVGGVGRGEGDRESISARSRNTACSWSVDEGTANGGTRVQLSCRECCSIGDVCWIGPGHDWRRRRDGERSIDEREAIVRRCKRAYSCNDRTPTHG